MNIGIIIQLGFLFLSTIFCLYQFVMYRKNYKIVRKLKEEASYKRLLEQRLGDMTEMEGLLINYNPDRLSPKKKIGKHKMN